MKIYGVGAAEGIGIGIARVVKEQSVEVIKRTVSDIEAEVKSFTEVLESQRLRQKRCQGHLRRTLQQRKLRF